MGEKKKLLIIQTSGTGTPERTAAPFYIATSASTMDMDVTIVFTINGSTIVKKGAAEKVFIKPGSNQSLKVFLDQAVENGVKLIVCYPSLELHDIKKEEIIPEVSEIIGGAALVDMAFEADRVLTF
ncbi:MAG: DsrE/DsrF/DrsH-like family protein [Nitrospirota bacterium]